MTSLLSTVFDLNVLNTAQLNKGDKTIITDVKAFIFQNVYVTALRNMVMRFV